MKRFKVTMDKSVRNITITRSITVFMGIITCTVLLRHTAEGPWSVVAVSSVILLSMVTYAYLFFSSPKEYQLTEDKLIIKKNVGKISIPISEIHTINVMDSSFLSNRFRTSIANSGVFGYMGTAVLNHVHTQLCIKRLKGNILIIRTQKPAILISPNDIFLAIELMEVVDRNKFPKP